MVDRPISFGSWGRKVVSQGRAPFHRIQVKENVVWDLLKSPFILDHTISYIVMQYIVLSKISSFSISILFLYRLINRTNFRSTGFFEGFFTLAKSNEREFHVRRCYLLRSKSFPSVEQWNNGTMAEREKGLISSRHILIYAVNLIRQRGSLYNVSFHSSKLLGKAGSGRIDTRSRRVRVRVWAR